jgi:peroxiredoxin
MSELRGLGDVHQALVDQGGTLLAISVDSVADNKRVGNKNDLPFPVLSDEERSVVWSYGVLHKGGAMDGSDVALPAMVLIDCNGNVAWRYVAKKVQSRLDPKAVLALVAPGDPSL